MYRLNASLVQQEVLRFPSGTTVLRIALSSDQSKLIVCVSNGSCITYNADNLNGSSVQTLTFQNVQAAGNNNVALVSAPVSGGGNSFYVGSSNGTVILIGQYGLDGTAGSVSRTSGNLFSVTASSFTRNWYGGFVAGSYTYFVVLDSSTSSVSTPGMRLLRVCHKSNETSIAAMYEIELDCYYDNLYFSNSRITGASLVSYPMSLNSGMYEDRIVIGIVNLPVNGNTGSFRSTMCTYSLTKINEMMDAAYTPSLSQCSLMSLPWRTDQTFTASCSAPCNISSPGAAKVNKMDATSFPVSVPTSNASFELSYSLAFNIEGLTLLFIASTNKTDQLGNSTVQAVSINGIVF